MIDSLVTDPEWEAEMMKTSEGREILIKRNAHHITMLEIEMMLIDEFIVKPREQAKNEGI